MRWEFGDSQECGWPEAWLDSPPLSMSFIAISQAVGKNRSTLFFCCQPPPVVDVHLWWWFLNGFDKRHMLFVDKQRKSKKAKNPAGSRKATITYWKCWNSISIIKRNCFRFFSTLNITWHIVYQIKWFQMSLHAYYWIFGCKCLKVVKVAYINKDQNCL